MILDIFAAQLPWQCAPDAYLRSYDTDTGNNGTDMGGGANDPGTTGGGYGSDTGGLHGDYASVAPGGYDPSAVNMAAVGYASGIATALAAMGALPEVAMGLGLALGAFGLTNNQAPAIESVVGPQLDSDPAVAMAQISALGLYGAFSDGFATMPGVATGYEVATGFSNPVAYMVPTAGGALEVGMSASGHALIVTPNMQNYYATVTQYQDHGGTE